ncbi:MAG TPA: hypothetical protein VGR71_12870, partial [Nitrospira sp.]|nr:hypothetical protein [Nitrospira sp.]
MTEGASWLWFLSCYSPLFFLIAIRAWAIGNNTFALVATAIGTLAVVSAWVSTRLADPPTLVTIKSVRFRDTDVPAYLMTYIVPFVGVTTDSWLDALVLAIVLGLVGLFYIQSDLKLPNPTVQIFGYRWMLLDVDGKSLNVLATEDQRRRLMADTVHINRTEPW